MQPPRSSWTLPSAPPPPLLLLLLLLPLASPAYSIDTVTAIASQIPSTALGPPMMSHALHGRDAADSNNNNDTAAVAGEGDGRRRPREQWDFMGPALLLGGTLAALMLAAIGHLASKALLASMLSAALSAVQLARQPPPNRPG